MKKILSRFTLFLVAFCMVFTSVLFAACEDKPDGGGKEPPVTVDYGDPSLDGYIITLVYPDGTPVKGTAASNTNTRVGIRLTDSNGNVIAGTTTKINVSGVGIINYKVPGVYKVEVLNCPSGYAPDEATFVTTADKACHTFKLNYAPPTAYTVTVNLPDGSPAVNKRVDFIDANTTAASVWTDENGVATTEKIDRRAYNVKVRLNASDNLIQRATKSNVAADPVNIVLEEHYAITFEDEDELKDEKLELWDNALNNYTWNLIRFDALKGDNYAYTADVKAGKEVFYSFKAPKTGNYVIGSKKVLAENGKDSISDYEIKFYANDLSYFDDTLTIDSSTNSGNNIQKMRVEQGETLTFSVTTLSKKAGTVDFIVCYMPQPDTIRATEAGDFTLVYDKFNEAIISFTPEKTGVYTITSDTDYDVMLVVYGNSNFPLALPDGKESDLTGDLYKGCLGDDNSGTGNNFKFTEEVTTSYLGNTFNYHIIIKDVDDTNLNGIQIKVKIERTGDASEEQQVIKKVAETNVSTKYDEQNGTFNWMPADGSLVPFEEDGLWYVTVGGEKKHLVAAITKKLRDTNGNELEYSFSTVELFGEEGGNTAGGGDGRKNNNLTVYEDLATRNITWNYTNFIAQYANYVNSDGVYQVNTELKTFLERYLNQRYIDLIQGDYNPTTEKPAQPWLLGCGYYA